ncbi:MAG: hypothetical protein BWY82_01117 [Verrucomicrobia bacterium ADurb.Bin474]|nr:MAG: hypothetical protein BWY82_01117 [Verrucomicrobia bacterium ADurb.Bin474]
MNILFLGIRESGFSKQTRHTQYPVHGSANLMTHCRQKRTLGLARPFGLTHRLLKRQLVIVGLGEVHNQSDHPCDRFIMCAIAGTMHHEIAPGAVPVHNLAADGCLLLFSANQADIAIPLLIQKPHCILCRPLNMGSIWA